MRVNRERSSSREGKAEIRVEVIEAVIDVDPLGGGSPEPRWGGQSHRRSPAVQSSSLQQRKKRLVINQPSH